MNRHMYKRQQEKNCLMHHGILGQKWGVRRFQNEDGSYTEAGKRRYSENRLGYGNRYHDYYNNAKKEYLNEKGGEKGYKKFYKEQYIPAMEKLGKDPLNPRVLVNAMVEGRLKDAYLKDYGGLDEYYRDKYAKLTNDAVRNNALARSAAVLTTAAGAMTFGVGIGVAPTTDTKPLSDAYNSFEKKIRYKDVKKGIDDEERLRDKFGVTKEQALRRIEKVHDNYKLLDKAKQACLKEYDEPKKMEATHIGTNITRDNNVELDYAINYKDDKNKDKNFELKSVTLSGDKDNKIAYVETSSLHPLKELSNEPVTKKSTSNEKTKKAAKEVIHYVRL